MIVVKAFRSKHEVRTSRASILSPEFFKLKSEMESKKTTLFTREATRDQTKISSSKLEFCQFVMFSNLHFESIFAFKSCDAH